MKIQSHLPAVAAFQRDGVKPSSANRVGRPAGGEAGAAPSVEAPAKTAPPGLERVLARLESLGEAGRTQGQNQAMDRIARNLARYQEHQALAPLPEPVPTVPEIEAEAPAPAPADPVVVETPPEAGAPDESPGPVA